MHRVGAMLKVPTKWWRPSARSGAPADPFNPEPRWRPRTILVEFEGMVARWVPFAILKVDVHINLVVRGSPLDANRRAERCPRTAVLGKRLSRKPLMPRNKGEVLWMHGETLTFILWLTGGSLA